MRLNAYFSIYLDLRILAILVEVILHSFAFPEIGLSADLGESLQQTTAGWVEVTGWKTAELHDTGRFLFGDPLENKLSQFRVPKSGIYFVSANIGLYRANSGFFEINVITNQQISSPTGSLSAVRSGQPDGFTFTLTLGGFVDLRASDLVSIYVYSERDTDWIIKDESQFCVTRVGKIGVVPGFAATNELPVSFSSNVPQTIRKWKTSGKLGLFESLTGFSPPTGQFLCICEGLYFIAANIHLQAGYGEYSLSFSVNGKLQDHRVHTSFRKQGDIFTINLFGAYFFKKGDSLGLEINSTKAGATYTIESNSSFSMSYIRTYNQSFQQGVSTVLQVPYKVPGAGKLEIKVWPIPESSPIEFYSKNTFQNGRFTCTESGIYYIAVNLQITSNRGEHSLLVISSGKSDTSGNGGLYTTYYNTIKNRQFSLILTGLLELSHGQYLSIFVGSKNTGPWNIEPGSSFSVVKTRYHWPAVHSYYSDFHPSLTNDWVELNTWTQTDQEGAFAFGNNLSPESGRYTVTRSGVHYIATNVIFLHTNGSKVEVLVAVNGIINTLNGLYATHHYPPDNFTLNIAGAASLQRGQNISVFVKVAMATKWQVSTKSGFSIVFIGSDFGIPAIHAVKGRSLTFQTNRWVNINNWLRPKMKSETLFENGGGWNPALGTYTAPVSGIYSVSGMIVLSNADVDLFGAYFQVNIGVNRRLPWTNGIQNTRWFYGTKPPKVNNTITMTVSGFVQLNRGDYVVVRVLSNMDFNWRIEAESSFSIFLVCPLTVAYGCDGFLSRKSDMRIKSPAANTWEKIGGWATNSDLTIGLFLRNKGSFFFEGLLGDLIIQHSGIYFVSVNIMVKSTPQSFEIAMGVSPHNRDNIEIVYNGLYAIENKPATVEGIYTLQFSGALFLTRDRKFHINVRSGSSKAFTILEGSGFAVARLIYPVEEPGFYSQISNLRIIGDGKWKNIIGWKTSGAKGLHMDGHGFNPQQGEFRVPLTGVYLASAQLVIRHTGKGRNTRAKLSVNGGFAPINGLESNHATGSRDSVTISLSGAILLNEDQVVTVMVKAEVGSTLEIVGGSQFSLRYISEFIKAIGNMADRHSNETFVTPGWHELVTWRTTGRGGQFQVGSIHQTNDRFEITESGIYVLTANIEFLKASGVVKIGIVINSGKETAATAVGSLKDSNSYPLSLHLAVPLALRKDTYVSMYVYSDDSSRWVISSHSSRSTILVRPEPNTALQGFTAYIERNRTFTTFVGGQEWVKIRQWDISGRSGFFQSGQGFLSEMGVFVVRNPGVYLVSANLMISSQLEINSTFELLVAISGTFSRRNGLFATQEISAGCIDTLNVMSFVQLMKWDTLSIGIRSFSKGQFVVLRESTYSALLKTPEGGSLQCVNSGPTMTQEISPAFLRTSVGNSVTWSCDAVAETPPSYKWMKNYQVIPGETSKTLSLINVTVKDSGDYACVSEVYPISISSNIAELTVYDPQPKLSPVQFITSVKENGPGEQLVANLSGKAESKSNNHADMLFTIISGNEDNIFQVKPRKSSGHFGIFTTKPLDREQNSFHQLVIEAFNTAERAPNSTTAVNVNAIDQNDNAPRFEQKTYNANISENATVGSKVFTLNAVDTDEGSNAVVTYHLLAGSGVGTFTVNRTTGDVELLKVLDRETRSKYTLFVAAKDPDYTSYIEVVIKVLDVNDQRPVFTTTSYIVAISEAAPIGSSITQVFVVDSDDGSNAEFVYSFVNKKALEFFSIDSVGVIRTTQFMDHEVRSGFDVVVTVQDKGNPPLTTLNPLPIHVIIEDVNEHSPQFDVSIYKKEIFENIETGASVLQVRATDLDGNGNKKDLIYSILDESANRMFNINSNNGIISIKETADYEETTSYKFQVLAKENENNPRVGTTTVIISVVDINDNRPILTQENYNVTVSEKTPIGTELMAILADDLDSTINGALEYGFVSGNEDSLFVLDELTGVITLTKPLIYEKMSQIILLVNVSDKGIPSLSADKRASVFIQVVEEGDHKPKFDSSRYVTVVPENSKKGFSLLTIHATDSDWGSKNQLLYYFAKFTDRRVTDRFEISPVSGVVSTKVELDYEEQENYRFTVVARDNGKIPQESFALVQVTVTDINDNRPAFEPMYYNSGDDKHPIFRVDSKTPVGTFVMRIRATDRDSGPGGRLSYSVVGIAGATYANNSEEYNCVNGSHGVFTIGEITGVITTAEHLASVCLYTISVRARDHGIPSLWSQTTVRVQTTFKNYTIVKYPPVIAFLSEADVATIVAVICICSLCLAIIAAVIIWREARRQSRKRRSALAKGGAVGRDLDTSSSQSADFYHWRYYVPDVSLDNRSDSSSTMAPSTPDSSRPSYTTDVDTDLLETYSLYDEKEGYYTLHSHHQSFYFSMDFGLEQDLAGVVRNSTIKVITNPFDENQEALVRSSCVAQVHHNNPRRANKSSVCSHEREPSVSQGSSLQGLSSSASVYETHL